MHIKPVPTPVSISFYHCHQDPFHPSFENFKTSYKGKNDWAFRKEIDLSFSLSSSHRWGMRFELKVLTL